MKIPDTPNIFAFTWLKGEDEFNCPTTCPQDEFQFTCSQFNGKLLPLECINEEKRCDGFEDCQNGSDESNCQLTCLEENQFQCVHERYGKSNFFQKRCFYIEGFHFYKVNIPFFCIFLDFS